MTTMTKPTVRDELAIEDEHTTEAMRIALKQGWKLPTGSITALRAEQAALKPPMPPRAKDPDIRRLQRNQQINHWRAWTKYTAAIDLARARRARRGR